MTRSVLAEPWRPVVVAATLVANAAGLIGLALCWWGASGEVRMDDQVPWLNAAVLTLVVVGLVDGLAVASARRAVTNRARALLGPGHPGAATP